MNRCNPWNCDMPNLTLAIDSETLRLAKIHAARTGQSLSAMVRAYLRGLAREDGELDGGLPADLRVLLRYSAGAISRHAAQSRLGVDYRGLILRLAEHRIPFPQESDAQARETATRVAALLREHP